MPAARTQVSTHVVRVLRDDERVGTRRHGRGTDALRDVREDVDGAEAAGHVRDVDPPSVEVVRWAEPPPDHGPVAAVHALAELR